MSHESTSTVCNNDSCGLSNWISTISRNILVYSMDDWSNGMIVHHTHKKRIQKLFAEGFTHEELSIMYKLHWSEIKRITYSVKQPERA